MIELASVRRDRSSYILRQYFPKKTPLDQFTQDDLDKVALELNERPRKTLGYQTPSEVISKIVALTPCILISLLRHRNASEQQIVAVKLKKAGFKVTEVCKQLSMDRSRYYRHLVQKPIDVQTVKLKAVVRQIHGEMHATYGSRRMRAELNAQGFTVGRYKVCSLMQSLPLKAKRPKQHRYPVAGKPSAVAPNALNRQFNPPMANVNWTGDITYIRTSQGWLYLAIVLDLYSRRVVSWAFSNQPNSELSVRSLEVAVQHRRPSQTVLFHSDQGVQYSSDTFRDVLSKHNITASMSRRGNCHDNAVTERFFRSLKSERVNYRQYKTRDEAMKDIADYI